MKVVNANHENDVQVVDLEQEVPDKLKPRMIAIETHEIKDLANKGRKMISGDNQAA